MNLIRNAFRKEREFNAMLSLLSEERHAATPHPCRCIGLAEGARNAAVYSLLSQLNDADGVVPSDNNHTAPGIPALVLVPDEKEAMRCQTALSELGIQPLYYPFRDLVFYHVTASHEYEQQRLAALSSLIRGDGRPIIATPDAALQYTVPPARLSGMMRTIHDTDLIDTEELRLFLVNAGYRMVDMVEGIGQFSIRGGIVDIFAPGQDYPIRFELFSDVIDSMGIFDPVTQRRIEPVDTITITPAVEVCLDDAGYDRLEKAIRSQLKKTKNDHTHDILTSELSAVRAREELLFLDRYLSVIYPEKVCLFDYLSPDAVLISFEYNALLDRVSAYEFHQKESVTALLEEGLIAPTQAEYGGWIDDFRLAVGKRNGVIFDTFLSSMDGTRLSGIFSFSSKQTVVYSEQFDLLAEDVQQYLLSGYSGLLLTENEMMANNLSSLLAERNMTVPVLSAVDLNDDTNAFCIVFGMNLGGFELPTTRFAVLSTYSAGSAFSRSAVTRKRKHISKKKNDREKIMSYTDLSVGDYVVHENHGIGRYMGMESVTVDGVTRDYVKIQYAGTDRLFLPCDQLDMISKYIGARSDDNTLRLSRFGGGEWAKTKSRVKKAAREMAKELIQLYAARKRLPGFAFSPDDEMQREFEEAFPYVETDGQLDAIREIKRDMQLPQPMDRLLCGDVGYGKTEVAIRAAFKAVASGKQVAILVPTTILALQHYTTLTARLRGFPVKVDMISRFKSASEQQQTIRKLRRGEIDILVGTVRLISKDVSFLDLGLVIVDEEQRFGVAAKEKLRQLVKGVDTLTLTATPIPRTMNMAMSGIRDMSILEEAPIDRVPVQTYVLEYDELIIADAIRKEMRRGGQVFYLFNRIDMIDEAADCVRKMVPDAKIVVAHGKMDKEELSDIWRDMLNGEIDVLVSTTIIEAGVDVPNANTLIIENADRLGLTQLHQIRGRVGRSSRRAYAYFTYRKGAVLTDEGTKRLGAIRDYSEFGSGFKVALRDMEIRGAGNLLGTEQHGHLDTVGYDLYMRILNEAVLEEQGKSVPKKFECTVNMNISAYIPDSYIKSTVQRIDIYKRIASIENREDAMDITDELLDRYGNMPQPVSALLSVSLLRSLGALAHISGIKRNNRSILFYPESLNIPTWSALAAEQKGRILMTMELKPYVTFRLLSGDDPLRASCDLLQTYLERYHELFPAEENQS